MQILNNAVVNSTNISSNFFWGGGSGEYVVSKSAAARVVLQFQIDGTNWIDCHVPNSTVSVSSSTGTSAAIPFYAPQGSRIRSIVATATSSTTDNVSTWIA